MKLMTLRVKRAAPKPPDRRPGTGIGHGLDGHPEEPDSGEDDDDPHLGRDA